jgi:hypothetical protein
MQDLQKVHLKGGFYIPLQHKNRFNDEQKHGDCRVLATTDDGTSDHPLNLNRDVLRFGRLVPHVSLAKAGLSYLRLIICRNCVRIERSLSVSSP